MIRKHRLLAEITVAQSSGNPDTEEHAKRALSLCLQGMQYQDPDGIWWEFGTVMHADRQEMLGRREVCAEEGHVLPGKVTTTSFGCARCDYIFVGQAGR